MKQKNMLLIVLGVLALLVISACTPKGTTVGEATEKVSVKSAPAFTVETTSGRVVDSEKHAAEGRPMVLYFMASTCSTCAKNWKNIDQVYPEYKDKVDFVAVSVDPTDSNELLEKLAAEKGFTFDTVAGNPELAVKYDVKKQTAKFAIDKDGNIVSRHDGLLTEEEWRDLFESLI